MEFQTLKKSYKKQIIIGAIAVCIIGGALTFNLTRAKYKVTEDIQLVRGTVNYKVPDLRVVSINTSSDSTNYTEVNDIPTDGYTLNTEKSLCKVYNGSTSIETAPKDTNISIEYTNGKVNILNVTKKNTRCYLYFDELQSLTVDDIIASTNYKTTVPSFSSTATTDQGVYAVSDGMYGGTSYYWRGAATTNYVKFSGFCWRIIRVNGDKTVRLIYDGTTCHANGTETSDSIAVTKVAYNTSKDVSNYVGWTYEGLLQRPNSTTSGTASNAKTQLESWYSSNITGTNLNKVAQGKYCNDRDVRSGSTWSQSPSGTFYYAAYKRIITDKQPTLNCPSGDIYTLSVGLITADEVMYAGYNGKYGSSNNSFYLYNGWNYWTMSPYHWTSSGATAAMFYMSLYGSLDPTTVSSTTPSLRPVINLNANTTFKAGTNGTIASPYEVL